jgi:gluconolactonase
MKLIRTLTIALGAAGITAVMILGQAPPPAVPRSGPGVQAAQDSREPEVLAGCKTPPPARGGGARGAGRGQGRGAAPAAQPGPRDYTVTEIPGVIAAGQKWKEVWEVSGNNADGIIGTKDGGLLIAQNDKSTVVKLDKKGKASVVYSDTNTGGAVSMNKKGALFVNERGLRASIMQLAPKRKTLADKYQGDSFDCVGGVLNDLSADSKGGAYFTMGGLFYADPKGVVTKYGENLQTNGVILSADEKTLYVTNGTSIVAFDVQPDGSLTHQREFAKLEGTGGGDGSTIDAAGRLYVTSNAGVHVIGPDGKYLGLIPTPRGAISTAFSGPDKKTLYVVARDNAMNEDWILGIQMIAQGYKGRAK